MSKIIILGTDLHGPSTELAAKTVNSLKGIIKNYKIVSIQNRKKFLAEKKTWVVPKIVNKGAIRKFFQAFLLPFYLLVLRLKGYNKILSFWVANSFYHLILFKFINLIGFGIIFTIISAENINFPVLKECDKIICQSENMKKKIIEKISKTKIKVIYPSIDTSLFKPSKKKNMVLIPSVPYSIKDFNERGIEEVIDDVKKLKLNASIICRSDKSYKYLKKRVDDKIKLINKPLTYKKIAKIMSETKIIPLIYTKNAPDMPLSAIEGLASGSMIICTNKMGISDIIKKEKAGIIIKDKEELENAIKKAMKTSTYNKNARNAAEKYFKKDNIKDYLEFV